MGINVKRLIGSVQFQKNERIVFMPAVKDQAAAQFPGVRSGIANYGTDLFIQDQRFLFTDMELKPAVHILAE